MNDTGSKARYDWSPAALDQFFGPDVIGEDPLPAHAKAIVACSATLTRAHRVSVSAVSNSETARHLLDSIAAVAIFDPSSGARPMRVVLMGRTMAGKSTLLAALTGGSVERIGVGAQRTSRDVFKAPAIHLQDVEIVDTPGVGAKDGAEDVALAMAEVLGADLVLWVASNDSFQEETAQALRAVAFRGKPIVVALNCRAKLVDDLDREDFLREPDAVFDQHEGHFNTIRAHLSAAGVRPIAEVMLHAEAARQALTDDESGPELANVSRIFSLLETLEREFRLRRTARRVLRQTDEVRTQAQLLGESVADVEQQIREIVRIGRGVRNDQQLRTTRLVDACQQRMEDDVIRIVGQRHGWHQTVSDFGLQVSEMWNEEQTSLIVDLDQALRKRLTQLSRTIIEASAAAEQEWAAVSRSLNVEGLRDFRGLWKRRAAGVAIGAGGALAVALLGAKVGALAGGAFGGPIGAGVGLIVGGVGTVLVSSLRKKVQSLFKGKAGVLEENREILRKEISAVLGELEGEAMAEISATVARIRDDLSKAFTQRVEAEAAALGVADLLASQQEVVNTASTTLDRETVVCLLQADGRPRLAAAVERVTRLAGVCVAVEITDGALAEAWLFPPSAPEIMAFGRPPFPNLPGARASSYVLGLTEEVPNILRVHADGAVVVTEARVPNPVLEAWSATLSDHLDTQVEIIRLNHIGSATT